MSDIAKQIKNLNSRLDQAVKIIVTELVDDMYQNVRPQTDGTSGSPVRTGRYYRSHRIGINAPDTSEYGRYPATVPPPMPENYAVGKMRGWRIGDSVHLSNIAGADSGKPYARFVETTGWKNKGPYGTYRVAAALTGGDAEGIIRTRAVPKIQRMFPPVSTPAKVGE